MSATTSPLSASQWATLEQLQEAARRAADELAIGLLLASGAVPESDPLCRKLKDEAQAVEQARHAIKGGYLYHVQAEWVGGDRFVQREPHIAGILPRRAVPHTAATSTTEGR